MSALSGYFRKLPRRHNLQAGQFLQDGQFKVSQILGHGGKIQARPRSGSALRLQATIILRQEFLQLAVAVETIQIVATTHVRLAYEDLRH